MSETKQTESFKQFWAEKGRRRNLKKFLSEWSHWWEYQEWRRNKKEATA